MPGGGALWSLEPRTHSAQGLCVRFPHLEGGLALQIALMTGSLLVLLLVAALVREVRLRRALQLLLRRLLSRWRSYVDVEEKDRSGGAPDRPGDRL
jgi:hypothetical protein